MNNSATNQQRGNSVNVNIVEPIVTLNTWTSKFDGTENSKELNMVSWNNGPAKLDLRNWYIDKNDGTKKAGKGVGLSDEEAINLMHALQNKFPGK